MPILTSPPDPKPKTPKLQRLVWGSDWPHVNLDGREMPNDGDLLDVLLDWVPDERTRNRILADNANRLYGF